MSLPVLPFSPTVANLDHDYLLTVNWVPVNEVLSGDLPYSAYEGWNILLANPPGNTAVSYFTDGLSSGGTVSSRAFQQTLGVGDYSINMDAVSADLGQFQNCPEWASPLTFPSDLSGMVTLSAPTLELGQALTITLSSLYGSTGISGWQVTAVLSTNSQVTMSSGPLPITSRTFTTIFTTSGSWVITVQTLSNFGANVPPVSLSRTFSSSVFVVNQQYSAAPETSITGTLGVGGEAGFELVDNSSATATPQPYEVIARNLVRDTQTNELKLLVATSRYSNASSLLGTMALDVFPFSGRPQAKELLEPLFEVAPGTGNLSPVKISTTAMPTNSYVGLPQEYFKFMVATGGNAPYSWFSNGLSPGLNMSIDGTISGTPTQLGNFTVNVAVMDSTTPAFIAESTFIYTIPTNLAITTTSLPGATVLTPYSFTLQNNGGLLPFTWSIQGGSLPVGLTLNPATGVISGVPCTYASADFATPFSVTVQVQDAVGALASQTLTVVLSPAVLQFGVLDQPTIFAGQNFRIEAPLFGGVSPYTLVSVSVPTADTSYVVNSALQNGLFEFEVSVPNNALGVHSFTVQVHDTLNTPITKTFYYTVATEVNNILVVEAAFDYDWENSDTSSLAHQIVGQLQGFLINRGNLLTVPVGDFYNPNGLVVTVNPDLQASLSPPQSPPLTGDSVVEVVGPPTTFGNTEVHVPIPLTNGTATVATLIRAFSLLSHDDTSFTVGDVGVSFSYTRPYLVNDLVGLNPQRPYFNSPKVINPETLVVSLKTGSVLPMGLSLDQVTGLVYGKLLVTFGSLTGGSNITVLQYLDSNITIYWDTQTTAPFSLNGTLPAGTLQTTYSSTSDITSNSPSSLASATVYRGHLPAGLTLGVSGTNVTLTGKPSETGYFDLWIKATNIGGQSSYTYQRFAVKYTTPLTILTAALPAAVESVAYSQTLQGYGGVSPYTWTSDMATSFAGLAAYITLNLSTGALTGTVPSASGLDGQSQTVTFTLTDSDGNTITKGITMSVNNALSITTSSVAPMTLSQAYTFAMQAVGGIPPYTWTVTAGTLPTGSPGVTINTATGILSGTPTQVGYGTQSITFQVTDSTFVSAVRALPVTVGVVAGMVINTSGVSTINRGSSYLGTLAVNGTYTTPVSWSVAGDSPNLLPTGLSLAASVSDSGATAKITGLYIGAVFTGYLVKVQAVDNAGHLATATLSLTASSNLAVTSSSPLPQGLINIVYSQQLTASGGGSPTGGAPVYTWSATGLPGGFSLSSSGLLTGTSATAINTTFNAVVTDGMSPMDSANKNLQLLISASTLAITTSSPLSQGTAGVAYSVTLVASGGTSPYTWQFVAGALPSGLNLTSNGTISGTTSSVGTFNFTVQVTDNISSISQKAFALTVITGMTLHTGVDYVNSTSTNSLGEVTSLDNVATISGSNRSFYVVATGVIATSPSQLSATVPSGFSYVVQSASSGTAYIKLSGPFGSGSTGSNSFSITVTDVGGVNASATFTWTVYTSLGPVTAQPSSGSIPAYGIPLLEGTAGSLPIVNNGSSFVLPGPFGGTSAPPASAATSIFALSGDNNSYQGLVSFGWDGTNFKYSYAGGSLPVGVALTNVTLKEQDIAWYSTPSGYDLFSTGQASVEAFLYMTNPTIPSSGVAPLALTIPSTNTTTVTVSSGQPQTETEVPSSYEAWISYGNLKNGGQDTITLYGSNNTVDTSQILDLTNFLLGLPSNATVTQVRVNLNLNQSAGTSATYLNVNLLGVSGTTTQTQIRGGNSFSFNGTWMAAQLNAAGFGVGFFANCTNSPGTGAIIQLTTVTLQVTYSVPNYNAITVTLSEPLSPQQQGTASSTGNSISATASLDAGVTLVSITPTYGSGATAGWLTGWVLQVDFPSGAGTITTHLTMTVQGTLTYLSGTSIVTQNHVYVNGAVATIVGTYSGGGGGGGGSTLVMNTSSLPTTFVAEAYTCQMIASGGTPGYAWSMIGSVPGLTFDSSGLLAGFAHIASTYNLQFSVSDSSIPIQTVTKSLTLTVA
jgi:hypothetical protein